VTVPEHPKVMTMPKAKPKQPDLAARLDDLEPEGPARDAAELREINRLVQDIAVSEQRLRDAVTVARAAGYSWGKIAVALGVSPQAAHQRFGGGER
jgi:hypothetical protein